MAAKIDIPNHLVPLIDDFWRGIFTSQGDDFDALEQSGKDCCRQATFRAVMEISKEGITLEMPEFKAQIVERLRKNMGAYVDEIEQGAA